MARKRKNTSAISSQRDEIGPIIQKAKTSIRRTGKLVRSFHCQKAVRKLKQLKEQHGTNQNESSVSVQASDDSTDCHIQENAAVDPITPTLSMSSTDTKILHLEQNLEKMKNFDLGKLVSFCLQQLGLLQNSEGKEGNQMRSEKTDMQVTTSIPLLEDKIENSKVGNGISLSSFEQDFVENMLLHKRLVECMGAIKESINSYNEANARRNENKNIPRKKRKKDERMKRKQEQMEKQKKIGNGGYNDYSGASGLFIASLSGQAPEYSQENADEYAEYDYNNYEEYNNQDMDSKPKRKNRSGQRARKAKALAIQARKEGRTWDKSTNWRPKKETKAENESGEFNKDTNAENKKINVKASEVANTGKNWKADGTAHPSWLAAQRQKKEGIVAFAGKKITFD